jgi:WD40 repeat protein
MVETWNIPTGKKLRTFTNFLFSTVNSVAFSPNGKELAVGGGYAQPGYAVSTLQIWDASTGYILKELPTNSILVTSVAFTPDGKTFIDLDGSMNLWDAQGFSFIKTLPSSASAGVHSIALSTDGKTLADGGSSNVGQSQVGVVELWNLGTDQKLGFATKATSVNTVSISPDGLTVADAGPTTTSTGVLETWAVPTQKLVSSLAVGGGAGQVSVTYSPSGRWVVDAGFLENGTTAPVMELRNPSNGGLVAQLPSSATEIITTAFSPDSSMVAAGGNNNAGGTLELWATSTDNLIRTFNTSTFLVLGVAFSSDGKTLADVRPTTSSSQAEIWNVFTGALLGTIPNANNGLSLSPDGKTLAAVFSDGQSLSLQLWNYKTQTVIATLPTTAIDGIEATAFSPDGSFLLDGGLVPGSSGAPYTGAVGELWSVEKQKLIRTFALRGKPSEVRSVAFSPDGKVAFFATDVGLQEFNLSSGDLVQIYTPGYIWSVAPSPKATFVAYGLENGQTVVAPYIESLTPQP